MWSIGGMNGPSKTGAASPASAAASLGARPGATDGSATPSRAALPAIGTCAPHPHGHGAVKKATLSGV